MGTQINEAAFVLSAQNRTQAAFTQLRAGFLGAQKGAEGFNRAVARSPLARGGQAGGRGGAGGGFLGGFGRYLAPAMVAGMGARYLRNQVGKADEIGDMADSMGLDKESAQSLKILARDTAVSFEGLGRSFAKLNSARIEALADPESDVSTSFHMLGVSAEDLKKKDIGQVFSKIGKVMGDARTPAWQMQQALELMGESGTKLGPIFEALAAKSLPELNAEFLKQGRIIDEQGLKKLGDLEAKYESLQDKISVNTMRGIVAGSDKAGSIMADPAGYVHGLAASAQSKSDALATGGGSTFTAALLAGVSKMTENLAQLLESNKRLERKEGNVFK